MKNKKKRRYTELTALKGRIREKKTSYRALAEKLCMGVNTLNDKINGYSIFNADEIESISTALDIDPNDVIRYFFPNMLRNAI